jgi:hypothetical protein
VSLTGVETVNGQDFGLQPVNASPTLAAIPKPSQVSSDAGPQSLALTGITAGAGDQQPLAVNATADPPELLTDLGIDYASPDNGATLHFTPVPGRWGGPPLRSPLPTAAWTVIWRRLTTT